jgi:hypothetical protein
MPADPTQICARLDRLKAAASTHFKVCDEMAKYIAPSRVGITSTRAVGDKQTRDVFDSTSTMAAELMAQFVASYTINPSQQWGTMKKKHPRQRSQDAINEWLEECRDRMFQQWSNSMFYAEGVEAKIDWCGFGTGFLFREERPQPVNQTLTGFRGFRYEAKKTGRFWIADGPNGLVDTVFEESEVSVRVLKDRWGEQALSQKVKNLLKENKLDEAVCVIHAIYPRPLNDQQYTAGAKKMPWASCWVEKDTKHLIAESGYRSFPGSVFRYSRTPGEVFGRGRGHIAFPDTWTLNTTKRMGLEDFALKIRPPVLHRHDSVIGTLRLTPGGPTSINTHGGPIGDSIMPFQTGSSPEVASLKEEELRKSIRQIFYVDQILMLMEVSKSEMTAFEFAKKMELLFRIMGPVYGRVQHEFLQQEWDGVFDEMLAAGEFSPPPQEIYETDGMIDTIFENPLARAQRTGDVEAITLAVQDMLPLAQVDPSAWDRIDMDKTVAKIFSVRGVPAICERTEEEVQAIREARQQSQEQEQQLAEAGQIAEAAGKAAPMLTALQGGNGQ